MLTKNEILIYLTIAVAPVIIIGLTSNIFYYIFYFLPITIFGLGVIFLSQFIKSRKKIILLAVGASIPLHLYALIMEITYGSGFGI